MFSSSPYESGSLIKKYMIKSVYSDDMVHERLFALIAKF